MIYLKFESCENTHESQHKAGVRARDKLFYLLGIDPATVQTEPNGKPYLESGEGFSVSHRGNVAVCALKTNAQCYSLPDDITVIFDDTCGERIGIDIEETPAKAAPERIQRIAERYLGTPCPSPEDFPRLWTRGEAYGKYTGGGITDAKNIAPNRKFYTFEVEFENKNYVLSICI